MSDPQHLRGTRKISTETFDFIRRMVDRQGYGPTAKVLGTCNTTLDRLLGPGVQPATRDRIEARVAELRKASA